MQEWDDGSRIWDPFSYLVTKFLEHALCGRTTGDTFLLRYMSRMGWAASGLQGRIGETTGRFALLGFGFLSGGGVAATSGVDFVLASRWYRRCLLSFRSFGEAGRLVVSYGQCRDAFGFNEVDETPSERAAWRKVVEAIESG